MNTEDAIKIIDQTRLSNSFTMGLTLDEFVSDFRKRYTKMFDIILPDNIITIAEIILKMNENKQDWARQNAVCNMVHRMILYIA